MKKSAKHTKQSFYDQQAIGLVSAWIAETKMAMPDLKALDKWPNIDGHIEVTDENGHKDGDLRVQVKKLSNTNARNKQHSFKDDKFLSYCRESEDWVPIIFIGVDLKNNKAFWLHIDRDFLNRNGSSKTVKFVETQVIESGTNEFIKDWKKIITLYHSKSNEFEKYKKLFSMLSDVINPALGVTNERFVNIHYFLDELNGYLNHTFSIVKQIFYPNTWKLGFAYFKYGSSDLAYALYPIARNKNDAQIKEIDRTLFNKIGREGLGFSALASRNPIETNPKEYAKEVIHKKISQVIKRKLLEHSGSEFLAKEYVFAFINKYRTQMGLEQKDKYSLKEIELAFYTYLPFWLKFSADLSFFPRERVPGKTKAYYHHPDQIYELDEDRRNEVKRRVERALRFDEPVPKIQILDERDSTNLSFSLFLELFHFLKQTGKRKIVRPYIEKDFPREKEENTRTWKTFSEKDIVHNLKMFFENLLEVYDAILRNNFPALRDELPLFCEADTILVSWDKRYISYKMYHLRAKTERKQVQIKLITEEDVKRFELEYPSPRRMIIFENKTYQLLSSESGIADFFYDPTPMLNFIYKKLKERIDEYFKKTEPSPKFDKPDEADEAK